MRKENCRACSHISIFSIELLIVQMALGYSAVLFGLIAVACATSKRYCLLPGVCFDTHDVPTPWQRPFKFNLAPFVLMAITQCVVRQSSFLGHLSGSFAHDPSIRVVLTRVGSDAAQAFLWASPCLGCR